MSQHIIPDEKLKVDCTLEEYKTQKDVESRRFYLCRPIYSLSDEDSSNEYLSMVSKITKGIMDINRYDQMLSEDTPPEDRMPIIIYINSPGGDLIEGFSLVSAIELSKTPVYTVNIGEWSSMAFLIGITGHKRFSFPYSTFLLHEGSSFAGGATNKVQDRVEFEKRFEREIVRNHVLKNSKMNGVDYDALARVEYYLLPKDALERGFIDEIIDNINSIL